MSNLLLITDVARLRNIFGGLASDKTIRLRIANSLEKGGEELAVEKPDVVFVQTYLSGLSADILIMHLKKQLGRKRSRFVLLAAPSQVSEAILAPYKGWLDTTSEDEVLFADLQNLLASLAPRSKKRELPTIPEASAVFMPELPIVATPPAIDLQAAIDNPTLPPPVEPPSAPAAESAPEPSLEEQGITYSPRPRFTVNSDFNDSFDTAISSAPVPEFISEVTTPTQPVKAVMDSDFSVFSSPRSKSSSFILWLAPVIIAVVVATFLQQRKSSPLPEPTVTKPPASAVQVQKPAPQVLPAEQSKPSPSAEKSIPQASMAISERDTKEKGVTSVIVTDTNKKDQPASTFGASPPTTLPDFIPRYGFDKHFGASNPGWERYKGQVTEFKVYRESKAIKAIQVIDRGGRGVPESFMKGVMKQIVKKPTFAVETTEKKDGYEIQRGHLAENIKVVYYRDVNGGKLRAFVISWQ